MVDTARSRFPESMMSAANGPRPASLEAYTDEVTSRLKQYARDEPISFALWAFGIGFVLGWRLKPW